MDHGRTHPVLIAASVAVLLFSLLGAAALTGVLPSAFPKPVTAQCADCGVVEAIRATGNVIENDRKEHTAWRVTVRLDDGSVRTLSQRALPSYAVGDRVRIVDGFGVERA
jgi:outer membrane lipoprotein SlyB